MKQHLFTTLSLLAICTVGTSQQMTLRGKVEDVSGTSNQFVLDASSVELSSGLLDLNKFVGMQTELTGIWNGSAVNPELFVETVTPVAESFEIGGSGSIGTTVTFEVTAAPGSFAAAYFSTDTGFRPVLGGAVLLDLSALSKIGQGNVPATGTIEFKVSIPKDSALIGLTGYGQGVFLDGGEATLTNPDSKTIRA